MSTIKDGGPAFPCSQHRNEKYMDEDGYGRTRTVTVSIGGMTLRDYFAAHALQSIAYADAYSLDQGVVVKLASTAYRYADAMLAAREVRP